MDFIPDYLKQPFIDWLSFTVEYTDEAWSWLESVFGSIEIEEKGYNTGHTHTFRTRGDVFGAFSPNRKSQKIYVSLSAKALFNFGSKAENLSELIQGAIKHKGRFTRIDLAQDDFEGRLDLPLILEKLDRKEVFTRFRGYSEFESVGDKIKTGSLFTDPKLGKLGYTIYIGAMRKSSVFVRIYNKKLQVGPECAYPIWNRLEFQLTGDASDQYCNPTWNVDPETGEILERTVKIKDPRRATFENRSFARTAFYYLKFLEPTYTQRINDLGHYFLRLRRKEHWGVCKWWTEFLKESKGEKIGLPKYETGLEDIDHWLKNQVSGAVFLMSDLHGDEYFQDLKLEGKEKFERNKKYQRLKEDFAEKKLKKNIKEIIDEVPF